MEKPRPGKQVRRSALVRQNQEAKPFPSIMTQLNIMPARQKHERAQIHFHRVNKRYVFGTHQSGDTSIISPHPNLFLTILRIPRVYTTQFNFDYVRASLSTSFVNMSSQLIQEFPEDKKCAPDYWEVLLFPIPAVFSIIPGPQEFLSE